MIQLTAPEQWTTRCLFRSSQKGEVFLLRESKMAIHHVVWTSHPSITGQDTDKKLFTFTI